MYKGKIICVDDEQSILNSLRSEIISFLKYDYDIELTQTAQEAIEILQECVKKDIDVPLVISDCIMPIMKGDELLIKVHEILPNTKTVMLTGQAEIENIKNAINKANLYRYLTKPWEKKDLQLTVNEALKSFDDVKQLLNYQKSLEDKIAQRTKQLQDYVNLVDKYVISSTTDVDGIITYASQAFCDISGYTKDELVGRKHSIIRHQDTPNELFEDLWKTIKNGKIWQGEMKNKSKSGEEYWVENTISPIMQDDKVIGYSSIRQNITAKKIIEKLAITDELTKLYNRRYFNKIFAKCIENTNTNNTPFALIIFDIDFFKKYNDYYGHQKGDEILKVISSTLQEKIAKVSKNDYLFRLGGEEFGIISNDKYEDVIQISSCIQDSVKELKIPHTMSTCSDCVSLSIGVYLTDGNSKITEDLAYKLADEALYKAKNSGRNRIEFIKG